MTNILVVYHASSYPLRNTIADHLYAFERYSGHRCFYFNVATRRTPEYLLRVRFDLIVFHTIFLSVRWNPENFRRIVRNIKALKNLSGTRIALPQDEFLHTDLIEDFVHEFGINRIFSVMPPNEWINIYPNIDRGKTSIHPILTGYLDDSTIGRIKRLEQCAPLARPIDIGYRAWHAAFWLGRHGLLKSLIAERFREEAPRYGLRVDISTRDEDAILGDRWFEHLLKCKYTIGVEGGSSILDRDGTFKECTEAYLREHPQASFEEVEAHCFPGLDKTVNLVAISPRHLEACATRTCQILVEGNYNGILQPGRHYISLKPDFSNINEVLELIRADTIREQIVEQAYQDIVESGRYTNRSFVKQILQQCLITKSSEPTKAEIEWFHRNHLDEKIGWVKVRTYFTARQSLIQCLRRNYSAEQLDRWRRWHGYLRSAR